MTTTTDDVLLAVRGQDKAATLRTLLGVFTEDPAPWRDELNLYALMLASRRATLCGTFEGLQETIETEHITVHRVPSPRNVSRAFKPYGRREARELDEGRDEE